MLRLRCCSIRSLLVSAVVLSGLLGAQQAAAQQLPPAARIYGSITVNGANAATGAVVTAYSGTTLCGTSSASGSYDGSRYYVDLDSSQPECASPGAIISLQVNGQRANETATVPFTPGGAVQQNLTVGPGGAAGPSSSSTGSAVTVTVTYGAGWNLVAGPTGTVFSPAAGQLFSLTALTNGAYAGQPASQPVTAGQGYWAYFAAPATVTLNGTGQATASATVPAGQFVMIGNPGTNPMTVSGADTVYTYTPAAGYVATTTIPPGRGAWAYSAAGNSISVR